MRIFKGPYAEQLTVAALVGLVAIIIAAGFAAKYLPEGIEEAYDQVTDSANYPPDLVDHGGRGPDDARGSAFGASSSITSRPTHIGTEYGYYQSPNWSSRGFNPAEAIVVHVTGPGTCPGMRSWFANPTAGASAQFGVCKDGSLEQYVDVGDGAWHAGIVNVPDLSNPLIASWIASGINPNSRTVGIELLLKPGENLADFPLMRETFHQLMRWLNEDRGITLDRVHVIGHYQIDAVNRSVDPRCCVDIDLELSLMTSPTSCPSGFFNDAGYQWDGCLEPYGRWENPDNGYGWDPSTGDFWLWGVKEWSACTDWGGRRNYRNGDFLPGLHSIFIDEGWYWSTVPAC